MLTDKVDRAGVNHGFRKTQVRYIRTCVIHIGSWMHALCCCDCVANMKGSACLCLTLGETSTIRSHEFGECRVSWLLSLRFVTTEMMDQVGSSAAVLHALCDLSE